MGFMHEFPHSRTFDSDLREIIEMYFTVKDLPDKWVAFEKLVSGEVEDLKNFVNNYFDNLNVQNEINNKLDAMIKDGTLSALIEPLFNSYKEEIALLKVRMDTFTALGEGSTTGDAELIDGRTDYRGNTHSNIGGHIREITSQLYSEIDEMVTFDDIVNETGNFWINRYSQERTASDIYISSEYIPVKGGQSYYLTAKKQSDEIAYDTTLNVYDSNKVWQKNSRTNFENTEWIADYDGYIILTNFGGTEKPSCKTYDNHVINNIEKIKERLTEVEKNTFDVSGKTIIWFGTSIPHGTWNNNYPDMVGKILNCVVINQAVGSSTARTGITSRVTDTDPMGIVGTSWKSGTRALTQTIAEKQHIIDNWETVYGAKGSTPFSGAPETLTDEEKEFILNTSYERLLTPYLDGTYELPDIFIFDHGYNDGAYENSEEMSTVPMDDNDRHYFIGAMNKLIRMILNVNPTAKILLIGHFENDYRPHVNKAQEKIADIWGFPLLKLWEISGISNKEITVKGVPTTSKLVYCPDGVHPHSDETGATNAMLAEKISKWIVNII